MADFHRCIVKQKAKRSSCKFHQTRLRCNALAFCRTRVRCFVGSDTQDFSEDTYRTLAAADNAVMLVDAAKGLEPQTRKLFEVRWRVCFFAGGR